MSEFIKPNDEKRSFSGFQQAMEDPIVIAAGVEAGRRADAINKNFKNVTPEEVQKHVSELDMSIGRVMGGGVVVSGRVQKLSDGGSSEFHVIPEVDAQFYGFIENYYGDKITFDYMIRAPISTDTGEILTKEAIKAASADGDAVCYSVESFRAVPGEVFMKFEEMHPAQAYAILGTTYPDTLRDLDDRIIHLGDDRVELALLALRGFSIKMNGEVFRQDNDEYIKATASYVRGMVTVDTGVPYLINIDGPYADSNRDEKLDLKHIKSNGRLLAVDSFGLYALPKTDEQSNEFSFIFTGILHSEDPDIPGSSVVVPIESITSIRSMRRMVAEAYTAPSNVL